MNKLLYGIIAILGSIGITIATSWVNGVNADRKADHETLSQLVFKDRFLNGDIPLAPVAPVAKK